MSVNPTTLDLARDYVAAGLSIIPLKLDGSKSPSINTWTAYQNRIAIDRELQRWFSRPAGVGLVCGIISQGLEVIDFDYESDETFFAWRDSLPTALASRLTVVETGGLGYHVLYRCKVVSGSTKIAKTSDHAETIIESRGQGGYVIGVGSPLEVHSSRSPYVQTHGKPLPAIPVLTPEQRKLLWCAAAKLDRREDPNSEYVAKRERELYPRPIKESDPDTPWDDFDSRAQWSDILSPHGWRSSDGANWTRPGKEFGVSARVVTAKSGDSVLTVFSANAGAISPA